jgi:peptidoglycan/LPS O-acetylase OafA/YrhL
LRLLPGLLALLVVWSVRKLCFEAASAGEVLQAVVVVLLYSSNWLIASGAHLYGITAGPRPLLAQSWSLAIEEQFYLLWPAALVLLLRLKIPRRRLLLVPLIGAALSASLRSILWSRGATWARLWMGSDSHADPILIGCAVGLIGSWKPSSLGGTWALRLLAGATLLPFLVFAVSPELGGALLRYGMLSVLSLSVGGLILTLVREPSVFPFRLFESKSLVWVGRRS